VGMQKTRLAVIVLVEMIFIGLTGIISGIAASLPIMLYYKVNPIHLTGNMAKTFINYGIEPLMPLAFKPVFILGNVVIVLIIIALTCIYPVRKIFKLNVVEALRK
jgi:ABC-type antimicrobial peptide transport system permease subunit